ncbi:DUF3488 and transglutaminase-like domain-containing protein [Gilvimarinus sp. SDUM040013]|uniref:DUF3488 and transglutaminase-like domain-containing protein n=1 Tax=Gilvimarinus gilvus TaxID=3058038 RepID=A0ABU4RYF6_9GAMM|nr:DUF3488 and transglutaminase-like domain-containing protein [Gilvimarinus sp. SDUM040013]MDO3386428.1 DUF3488 and transglutaminase-like domain-containing protein [Gilvimarinus sp. SDUM040013]MDX6849694.1 DUF3488 and transglutaminase-like domain-containing protein [Gilvimarinus sp. SDUM040013]
MKVSFSLSVKALRWLLLSQLFIVAPLVLQLPIWLTILAFALIVWRFQLSRGLWYYPGRWLKVLVAVAVTAGLAATFRSFAMDAMVSLLVAGFVLKLTELRTRSDACLLSYLGYFVIGTQLLYTSGIIGAFYALVCVLLVSVTVMVNHAGGGNATVALRSLRTITIMLMQATPFMLVLFFVVPRVGSLWTVPLNNAAGTTGVSSSMSPGDFSSLMESSDVAFRATFEDEIPEPRQLYWRALVLDHFDGRTWTQSNPQDVKARGYVRWRDWQSQIEVSDKRYDYEILLEPTDENWLYALAAPTEFSRDVWMSRGMTLYQKNLVSQRQQYTVSSYPSYTVQAEGISDYLQRSSLQLPRNFNPYTRQLAKSWMAEAGSPEALIQRFLTFIENRFHYTLQPSVLGKHSIDEFLTDTRAGFCEHFAGSFVFFMRAAGIPARVVVGYQGGKVNPVQGYLTVRQLDAHAWAEVWLEAKGWVRVDPTFAVAPERIDRGVEFSLGNAGSQLLGDAWSRRFYVLANLRDRLDAFNYRWHIWVMNYDGEQQKAFMQRIFGDSAPWRIVVWVSGIFALIIAVLMLPGVWRKSRNRQPLIHRLYLRMCRYLSALGYQRHVGEGARDFALRVSRDNHELGALVLEASDLFERHVYQNQPISIPRLRLLVHKIKARRLLSPFR